MRVIPRAEVGYTRGIPGGRHVPLSARRFFVAHWPVMAARDERQWCRDIDRMHANQGWAVIGYNFLVGQSGNVYEGAGRDTRGIHSPPRNTDGIGVVFLQPSTAAGVPTAPMSQAMRNAGRELYETLCAQAGRRLSMSWHGQHFATACPGPDVRGWVQSGMPATGGPAPPPPPSEELTVAQIDQILRRLDQIERQIQNNTGVAAVRGSNNVVHLMSGSGRIVVHPPGNSGITAAGVLNILRVLGMVGPGTQGAPKIDDAFINRFPVIGSPHGQ